MMNKQEVIDDIENAIPDFLLNDYQRGKEAGLSYALESVEELDEPEKVVIPQSVADWLEVCKENLAIGLFVAMTPDVLEVNNQSAETIYWLKSARNQETFAKAWIYGYEIEKEKLYTVKIPNPNKFGNEVYALMKNVFKDIIIKIEFGDDYKKRKAFQLTEAEIKKDFEWAWRFAEEVE